MNNNNSIKNQLFNNFKNSGVEDQLKKELRIKLIEKLKTKNIVRSNNDQQKNLFDRVMASLISQELIKSDCNYTESVYSVQAGFQGKTLSRHELIQMIALQRQNVEQQNSILSHLILHKPPFSSQTQKSTQVQVNSQQIGYTIQQKLMLIDQQYRITLASKQNNKLFSNSTNLTDRKKYELQLLQKNKRQMELFRQFEIHKVKIQVSEEWRKKFQEYSGGINDEFCRKFDQLRRKEKQLNEQFIAKHKQFDIKVGDAEKTIRQKVQMLDMKNLSVQTQMDNVTKNKQMFQSQMLKRQKQLAIKIKQYDSLLLSLDQKIKYQVGLAKLSIQQDYQQKQAESIRRRKFVDEQYSKLMSIKDTTTIIERQNERLSQQNELLRKQLTTIQKQLKGAVCQLGNKVQRIQVLKQDNMEIKQKLRQSQENKLNQLKKCKQYQSQILQMRKYLQNSRKKIQTLQNSSSIMRQDSSIDLIKSQIHKQSDIGHKLELLRLQRQKDIQKLKMEM